MLTSLLLFCTVCILFINTFNFISFEKRIRTVDTYLNYKLNSLQGVTQNTWNWIQISIGQPTLLVLIIHLCGVFISGIEALTACVLVYNANLKQELSKKGTKALIYWYSNI